MAIQKKHDLPITTDIPPADPTIEVGELKDTLHSVSTSMPVKPSPKSTEQSIELKQYIEATTPEQKTPSSRMVRSKCYDSFRTGSGRFETQVSNIYGKTQEIVESKDDVQVDESETPSAERYFDALEGPELESLKKSESLILPEDEKWPFLLRFPVSTFSMPVGLAIQALLCKNIATSPTMSFLHVRPAVNFVLWCISLVLMISVASIYSLKIIFYFAAVKREFLHPVRVNFFFTPWIGCMLIVVSVPPLVAQNLNDAIWYVLVVPVLCLILKIYGQWMMGGDRRLSKVANPSNYLSVAANFSASLMGSYVGLKEGAAFFFAVGLAHYIVLFVTLYQRLPTNETLPKELHPVFFLFVAAPSLACLSWTMISGNFDLFSRMLYFVALFLYASLAVRLNFFRGFRFSLAWWAYSVPTTSVAIASIKYTAEVNNNFTKFLSAALSSISALVVAAVLITTILQAFVFHSLFPNDIAIAITVKRDCSALLHNCRTMESSASENIPSTKCIPLQEISCSENPEDAAVCKASYYDKRLRNLGKW
ncbi:hypothetical protein HPP92_005254 [Vanilla planifolia]|uniref:Uncharacterized protein n=1 Tax=Vanilla planifolia TaxID=51239 RepID=A0A835RGT8_VANPL|nr:hypothetical protein HPP92_005254 [Vanilla planifolia]